MGLVYLITIGDDSYIGSTKKTMRKRKKKHKDRYNDPKCDVKLYVVMREFGFENCEFEIIERYDRNITKELLLQNEQNWCDILEPTLNSYRAYRSPEYLKKYTYERNKRYRENNRDRVNELKRLAYHRNKDSKKK